MPRQRFVIVGASLCGARAAAAALPLLRALGPTLGRFYRDLRAEQALNHGPAAARAMRGAPEPYARLPYFFSDQYDVGMEHSGVAAPGDHVVIRGDLDQRRFIAFWLRGDRVTAAMNVNVWDVHDQLQALILSDAPVERRRLRDPQTPLDRLAGAQAASA
jgi:3-phenylpropionate/trans-cinnamate dioxygenase ferredoxin reductase subunit